MFKLRMAEHRYYPKNGSIEELPGEHFRLAGHAVSDLFGLAIKHVKNSDPFVLKAREAFHFHSGSLDMSNLQSISNTVL